MVDRGPTQPFRGCQARALVAPGLGRVTAAFVAVISLGSDLTVGDTVAHGTDGAGLGIALRTTTGGAAVGSGGQGAPPEVVVDPDVSQEEVERVAQVKGRHETALMSIAGVVGVGVGLDAAGHVAIQVYVVQATPEVRQAIPVELEGVPVSVVETGEFEAR